MKCWILPILPPKQSFNQSIHFSPLFLSLQETRQQPTTGTPITNHHPHQWDYNKINQVCGSLLIPYQWLPLHMYYQDTWVPKGLRRSDLFVSIPVRVSPPCSQSFIHTCLLSLGTTPSHPMLFPQPFLLYSFPGSLLPTLPLYYHIL